MTSLSCIGEGNGNPLHYSCLENPRDGGAWWAVIYGVAQSQTRLKRLSYLAAAAAAGTSAIFLLTLGRVIPSVSVLYRSIFLKSELISKNSCVSGSQSRDFCPLGDIWQCPETFLRAFSDGSVGRESACNEGDAGDVDWIPGLGRSPGKGIYQIK